MTKNITYLIYKIIFFFLKILDFIFKRRFSYVFKDIIVENSYEKIFLKNKKIYFFIPNTITKYRLDTFFSKEPKTLKWKYTQADDDEVKNCQTQCQDKWSKNVTPMNIIPSGLVKNANPKNTPLHKNPAPTYLFSKEYENEDEPAKIKNPNTTVSKPPRVQTMTEADVMNITTGKCLKSLQY